MVCSFRINFFLLYFPLLFSFSFCSFCFLFFFIRCPPPRGSDLENDKILDCGLCKGAE
ncbi:hypothetical protein BDV33DRAFT_175619 [Aspergillus novoparasiticus]|uniref:Uncharacterized protein n=1 Tax=Aspergillus novoparasiticus TaxID=986946 RepID=A0A5N6EPV0_9EURO|nr:hypothetical protein BDV33DRAFT_175619 [Aspergillus novoparasiticus]